MAKDYNNWTKEQLVDEVARLRKRKKYGLVWEPKEEDAVEHCKTELPVLKEVKNKAIAKDKNGPVNILIEGDNYHALSVLNYTHKSKVDVIYIDPPYNTGSGDFKYNDKFVDKEDTFRHSKWLSFLSKRVWLAKNLLKEGGVMFVSIDDNEQAQLKMLLCEIFGEDNVDIMIWRKSGYGRDGKMKNTTTFRKDHEYILVCYKHDKKLNKINEAPEFQNEYGNPDNDPRGPYKAGSISRREDASNPNHDNFYPVTSPSGKVFKRQFDLPKEDFDQLNSDFLVNPNGDKVSRIFWGANGDAVPAIKIFIKEERSITPYSVLLTKGTTTEGTKEVSEILKKDCKELRPKPTKLIGTLIQLADKNKTLTVLDFFAGTGTTGHALLKYGLVAKEKEVKFILCTNDEGSICSEYCYPRISRVIEGYKKTDGEVVAGLSGNLRYFRTAFVGAEPNDKNKEALTKQATEMLCMREDTFELVKETKSIKFFKNGKRHTGIVFDEDAIPALKKEIARIGGAWSVYIFSLGDDTFDEEFADMKKITVAPIPEAILRVYRRLFQTT